MIAFIFPGQGSQQVGMGQDLAEHFPASREAFDLAGKVLGYDLWALCVNGPEGQLKQTEYAQPALLVTGIACWRAACERGLSADFTAGHSLGEYTALVASGALDLADAVRLVKRRSELMSQAAQSRPGAMAALLGLSREQVESVCAKADDAGLVQPANFNCPGQIVISGEVEAVAKARQLAAEVGGKAIPLAVSGAFHSPLMAEAALAFAQELAQVPFADVQIPVVANVSARPVRTTAEIREALARQMISPVLWEDSIRRLIADGVDTFLELGPGGKLSGMIGRIDASVHRASVADTASLDQAWQGLTAKG